MSLQSRLSSLITAVGADIKSHDSRINSKLWTPPGALAETIPRWSANNNTALTSGVLWCFPLTLPAGKTITSISFFNAVTIATATRQWFCLIDQATRAILRNTSDATNAAWTQNTVKTLNLTSTYTSSVEKAVYLGIMVAAGTMPSLKGSTALATALAGLAPILCGTSNTGLTTPLAEGTVINALTATTNPCYGYVS